MNLAFCARYALTAAAGDVKGLTSEASPYRTGVVVTGDAHLFALAVNGRVLADAGAGAGVPAAAAAAGAGHQRVISATDTDTGRNDFAVAVYMRKLQNLAADGNITSSSANIGGGGGYAVANAAAASAAAAREAAAAAAAARAREAELDDNADEAAAAAAAADAAADRAAAAAADLAAAEAARRDVRAAGYHAAVAAAAAVAAQHPFQWFNTNPTALRCNTCGADVTRWKLLGAGDPARVAYRLPRVQEPQASRVQFKAGCPDGHEQAWPASSWNPQIRDAIVAAGHGGMLV